MNRYDAIPRPVFITDEFYGVEYNENDNGHDDDDNYEDDKHVVFDPLICPLTQENPFQLKERIAPVSNDSPIDQLLTYIVAP